MTVVTVCLRMNETALIPENIHPIGWVIYVIGWANDFSDPLIWYVSRGAPPILWLSLFFLFALSISFLLLLLVLFLFTWVVITTTLQMFLCQLLELPVLLLPHLLKRHFLNTLVFRGLAIFLGWVGPGTTRLVESSCCGSTDDANGHTN